MYVIINICRMEENRIIDIFSREKRYEQSYTEKIKEIIAKGKEIYMCFIADEIEKKGIEKGRKEGLEKGMEKGMEKGLGALVASLMPFMTDFQQLYQAVIKNEIYQNVTQAQVKKYY